MDETTQPLLDNNGIYEMKHRKSERKIRGKLSGTIKSVTKTNSLSQNITNLRVKDSKAKKIENRFIFKVYIHFFIQILFVISIIILSFKIKQFNSILSTSKFLFYTSLFISFILLIYPLFNDFLLKIRPYNYFYLLLFTISLSYIICKLLISFKSTFTYKFVKVSSILFIFQLLYLIINEYIHKKKHFDISNTSIFLGLCLLFIGSILYFIEKITFFKLILVILIILLFGIYLLYDTNLIFRETRRKFQENDYVLATIYLYIDIIQTIFELIKKFYNSYEPEAKPINKHGNAKSMIYTGDEAYTQLYQNDDEKKEDDSIIIKRTNSANDLKNIPTVIKEVENENDPEENVKDNDATDQSFKRTYSGKNLVFDDNEEDNEN